LSRLFVSHSSNNDEWALALRDWLVREGWSGADDIFLDFDPQHGIAAGERWRSALETAATRCEAVLCLISTDWLASKWCHEEYELASRLNKKLFALLIDDTRPDELPDGLSATWQLIRLKGDPAESFAVAHPRRGINRHFVVQVAEAGLKSLKRGLEKAGIGPETFSLQPDPDGPFGWRTPYRGLQALEQEDAAVFFGRRADIVRGIDALRGLAARKPPRLLAILGASGAGKSSFMRAGLWPRLLRDDAQWLPLKPIRAAKSGAIQGDEGLLAALEDVHRRFALQTTRADLRKEIASADLFVALLKTLRQAAGRRALISTPPYPLPVLCLDQGEELFRGEAGPENERLLQLARAAIEADQALLLVTIRSDAYDLMQNAQALAGIEQTPLSLGPVPHGEIGHIIREPSEVLRRNAGSSAPMLDAAVVEALQAEIEGESDALPLLAFVLQRLMREHIGKGTIGVAELAQTGGVGAAIEREAEAALVDAGYDPGAPQRAAVRRLFIPQLARIDPDSQAAERRVGLYGDVPGDLLLLAHSLTERRLLVAKLAAQRDHATDGAATFPETDTILAASADATIEVAHESLLRRWPTLTSLLAEDREALLLLDSVRLSAMDWFKADAGHKTDFLAHHGSRLAAAQALATRGPEWGRELAPARDYLAACVKLAEDARKERLSAMSDLTSGIAHEINNPTGISLMVASTLARRSENLAKEIQEQGVDRSKLDEFISGVREGADQMVANLERSGELIQRFKALSMGRDAERGVFDLKDITNQTIDKMRAGIKKREVMVAVDIPSGIVMESYPSSYQMVIVDIILNSLVHGFADRTRGWVGIDGRLGDEDVEIRISDDGAGMSPSVRDKALMPFFKRSVKGAGLGLTIAYNLINRMGGKLTLESEPGAGTRVLIKLPRIAPS
jgi:signal transduction histidine kinase